MSAMNLDHSSALVVEIAKEFLTLLRRIAPTYEQGFWRFRCLESQFGSNASYVEANNVSLVSAVREANSFERLNNLGRQLWELESDNQKRFLVCLLVVDSSFNYKLHFESTDISKWEITKLNGNNGIPSGL